MKKNCVSNNVLARRVPALHTWPYCRRKPKQTGIVNDIFRHEYRGQRYSKRCGTVSYAQSEDDAMVCYIYPSFGAENDINDCRRREEGYGPGKCRNDNTSFCEVKWKNLSCSS